MSPRFAVTENKKRVQTAIKTLEDVIVGKMVSKQRLDATKSFLVDLLEEINSKRPQPPIRCGGNV